jgi:hypothetical protein
MPLLGDQHRGPMVSLQIRREKPMEKKRRERSPEVGPLAFFALVDTTYMMDADALAPAVEADPIPSLVSRSRRVAHEPEMGVETDVGQGFGQTGHPSCDSTGTGIGIGSLEGNYMKLHGIGSLIILDNDRIPKRSAEFGGTLGSRRNVPRA